MEYIQTESRRRRLNREGFSVDHYFAFLHISQRPSPERWEPFRRDMEKVARLLHSLPAETSETRLSRSIRRLQSHLTEVVLFRTDPRECYAAFSETVVDPPRSGPYLA